MKLFSLKLFYLLLLASLFLSVNIFAADLLPEAKTPTELIKEKMKVQPSDESKELLPKKTGQTTAVSKQDPDSETLKNLFSNATYEDFEPQKEYEIFDASTLGSATSQATGSTLIDSGAITFIQTNFLGNLNTAFATVAGYARNLLYLFAVFEIVIFGFIWVLRHDIGLDKLFFKIIKIGLIFFIIQNYTWLLDTIMQSFAQMAGVVINNSSAAKYIFNPAKIWQYGYNSGVHLLQLATMTNNYGLVMVQISLGAGILLVFGLLGIQMILQIVGFYLVSLGALILLPFGTFVLGRGMFDRAVQAVLQAGIRLMSLITIIGIAVVTWDGFQLVDLATTNKFNINQPLGLFFTALLFLYLAIYLPKILSQVVGSFSNDFLDSTSSAPIVVRESGAAPVVAIGGSGDMQAATAIEATSASAFGGYTIGGGDTGAAASQPVAVITTPASGGIEAKTAKETLARASNLSKSISDSTVKRIKDAVLKAVKEK